jgi:endoglucanase
MSKKRALSAIVCSIAIFASLAYIQHSEAVAATGKIQTWWPTNGAHVTGTQPFKVVLEDASVQNYQMFWQVDGGQWNWMDSNYADYPHKETTVDLSGWSWKGAGPYRVNFIARDPNGTVIAQQAVDIYNDSIAYGAPRGLTPTPKPSPVSTPPEIIVTPTATPKPSAVPAPTATQTPVSTPAPTPTPPLTVVTGNPLANAKLYVNPSSEPKQWANNNRSARPTDAQLMDKIGNQPESQWFGDWNSNIYQDAKNTTDAVTKTGATPVYVIYNIPHRDCGSYSAGGASSASAYRSWLNSLVSGIGNRKAVALLEPDALAGMDCLNAQDKAERMSLLKEAVSTLESHGIATYIDAGHPDWISTDEMATRLKTAGVGSAHGFSLNISNFFSNADNIAYGSAVSAKIGGKHFVVDTGRNGSGPTSDHQWCNPPGRSLGQKPTIKTGNPLVDAYLWVKGPAGSDGSCNGAPSAGTFWPEYALDLAKRTNW